MNTLPLLCLCIASVAAMQPPIAFETSVPCMTQPLNSVAAGDSIEFELMNGTSPCEMTMTFTNPAFLPLRLEVNSTPCAERRIASFTLPDSLEDGIASIQWRCQGSDASSCNLIQIKDGCNDASAYEQSRLALSMPVVCVGDSTSVSSQRNTQTGNEVTTSAESTSTATSTTAPAIITSTPTSTTLSTSSGSVSSIQSVILSPPKSRRRRLVVSPRPSNASEELARILELGGLA